MARQIQLLQAQQERERTELEKRLEGRLEQSQQLSAIQQVVTAQQQKIQELSSLAVLQNRPGLPSSLAPVLPQMQLPSTNNEPASQADQTIEEQKEAKLQQQIQALELEQRQWIQAQQQQTLSTADTAHPQLKQALPAPAKSAAPASLLSPAKEQTENKPQQNDIQQHAPRQNGAEAQQSRTALTEVSTGRLPLPVGCCTHFFICK